MKSPADMRIILIDITNACVRECSNCTRFCGHQKKSFFMDYETFCRAVDSLDGFPGTVGIIGGEPTLHPDFERMARYLGEKRGPKKDFSLYKPQRNFMDAVHDVEMSHTEIVNTGCEEKRLVYGGGVWSVMGDSYKKHYEVIQDIAKYQALNDHSNPMYHKPALITRKELGISDKEWPAIRDNCWVVDVWSANITPKGAFFCEVAGCLDMLFNGPGGWDIEPGWWKRQPEEFGDQLKWCELCGMACETFTRDANEGIDDVSPVLYEKLKAVGSRKVECGKVNIVKIENGVISESSKAAGKQFKSDMPYVEHYSDRFNESKSSLYYKEFVGIYLCNSYEDYENIKGDLDKFKEAYIWSPPDVLRNIKKDDSNDAVRVFDSEKYLFGYLLWYALHEKDHNTYALCISGRVKLCDILDRLNLQVLNPGTMLYKTYDSDEENEYFSAVSGSEVMLINGKAYSIRAAGWDRIIKLRKFMDIKRLWQKEKVFEFTPSVEGCVPVAAIRKGKRYAVYGAGRKASDTIEYIKNNGADVSMLVDPNEILQDRQVCGFIVGKPEDLRKNRADYDIVMIAVGPYYLQAKEYLISIGLTPGEMAWI